LVDNNIVSPTHIIPGTEKLDLEAEEVEEEAAKKSRNPKTRTTKKNCPMKRLQVDEDDMNS
jgi:23S rRNA maturation mini-RNase III